MTIPSFADRIAPVHTTHNHKAFFTVSLLASIANVALSVYRFNKIRKYKLNTLKDEVYTESKAYKQIIEENSFSAGNGVAVSV